MDREKDKELEELLNVIPCPDNAEDLMTYAIYKYHNLAKRLKIKDTNCYLCDITEKRARWNAQGIIKKMRLKCVCVTTGAVLIIELLLLVIFDLFLQ